MVENSKDQLINSSKYQDHHEHSHMSIEMSQLAQTQALNIIEISQDIILGQDTKQ